MMPRRSENHDIEKCVRCHLEIHEIVMYHERSKDVYGSKGVYETLVPKLSSDVSSPLVHFSSSATSSATSLLT